MYVFLINVFSKQNVNLFFCHVFAITQPIECIFFDVNNIYFHVMIDVVSRKLQIAVFISLLVTDFDCSHEKYSIIM